METQPTEMTYAAELKSIIDSFGQSFRAEVERKIEGENLRVDLLVFHDERLKLIVEVKRPDKFPSLNDEKVKNQAQEYADFLWKGHIGLEYYGTHNLKHLMLYRKVKIEKKVLHDFEVGLKYKWTPVRPYPWSILPSAKRIDDFQGRGDEIKASVGRFLSDFRTLLEGKIQPIGPEIVHTIATQLEEIAGLGGRFFFEKYLKDVSFQSTFAKWLSERGIQRPKDDEETKILLRKLAMEQAYTLTLKLMFFHVLRLKFEALSSKLSDISISGEIGPEILKQILDSLCKQALVESGDFQIVFEMNLVDSIELPKYSIQKFMNLFNFLREVDWRSLDYDIIGTILEDMIWRERRHLLGQFFTRPEVVDLILAFSLMKTGLILDPCVGSGTFLVRAYQRIRYLNPSLPHSEIVKLLFGLDVDKNVAMLAAINIYIRDPLTTAIAKPQISRIDFFSDKVKPCEKIPSLPNKDGKSEGPGFEFELPIFQTIIANPPYTRQEEMERAFYSANYKTRLVDNSIKPVVLFEDKKLSESWSTKASIYSYFMVKSANEFLDEHGRLGFITSNSWLDSSFGVPLKEYFLQRFKIIAVIESSKERWFEDADINTTILVIEKIPEKEMRDTAKHNVRFVLLREPLSSLNGRSPSGFDNTEMRNYWSDLDKTVSNIENAKAAENQLEYNGKVLDFAVNDKKMRVIAIEQVQLKANEKWSVFLRAPNIWFQVFEKKKNWFVGLKESGLYHIRRGFTTNANELYYLPSKHWKISGIREKYIHILQSGSELILPISLVKTVVKSPTALKKYTVETSNLKRHLVYLQQGKTQIENKDALKYIAWMERLVASEFLTDGRFPTLAKKLFAPELALRLVAISENDRVEREQKELKALARDFLDGKLVKTSEDWYTLPERNAASFLCVPGINERFAFHLNTAEALEDKRLYGLDLLPTEIPIEAFFAILNSSITILAMELWGRTELGLGALDLAVEDYEAMPVLNARLVWKSIKKNSNLKQRLSEIVGKMAIEKVLPIEQALKRASHQDLDHLILVDILGLSVPETAEMQEEIVDLVKRRISRAKTVQLNRRSKTGKS